MGWLLNLSRTVAGASLEDIPQNLRLPASTFQSDQTFPTWTDRAIPLGVGAVDLAGGAIMDDFDGAAYSTSDPCGSMTAFRNLGDGRQLAQKLRPILAGNLKRLMRTRCSVGENQRRAVATAS